MPALLTTSSILMCPHGGMVSAISSNAQSKAAGDFILRASDTFLIAGCTFNVVVPHPCVQVQWIPTPARTQAGGDFTLNESSVGLCLAADFAVQGAVLIVFTQPQVSGQ
jgi:hypothetical protein